MANDEGKAKNSIFFAYSDSNKLRSVLQYVEIGILCDKHLIPPAKLCLGWDKLIKSG